MKKILSIVLLALTTLALSIPAISASPPVLGVNRFMIQLRNSVTEDFVSTLDTVQHDKMKALGAPNNIYTQADADNLDNKAFAHFLAVAGLDFTNVQPDAGGFRTISDSQGVIAIEHAFIFGNDGNYNVLFDSSTDQINKNNGNWTVRNVSDIVVYQRSGTVTTGSASGQSFEAGDLITYGFTDQLRVGKNWQLPENREHFIVSSLKPANGTTFTPASQIGKEPKNGFNQPEVHAALLYCDSSNRPGFGSDNVYDALNNGVSTMINHHVITFFTNPITNPCV